MQIKIILTGAGIDDGNFRCFYQVKFSDRVERRQFIIHLQNQPEGWSRYLSWVIDPKSNFAEAYVCIAKGQRDTLLNELNDFVENRNLPKLPWYSRLWRWLVWPYWWWKTRKL